jgi:site-specific DNA recombinase
MGVQMDTSPCAEIQAGTQIRAGVYLRISRDRAQLRLAVHRQEEDCRQVAERLGWFVAGVYTDNGLSASRFATRPRDEYRYLLDDIKAGRLDAVIVWMEDRSHRQVTEVAEFVRTCRAAGMSRYASVGMEYDLSDPDQVTMLLSIARVSEIEVGRSSTRIKRKLKELADTGQYHGGPKPYGYEGPLKDEHGVVINRARIGKAIVEEEATIVRETARQILSGKSLRSVVIGLNRRGIPAPRGALWTRRTLKVVLTHPRVAGLRQHQGTVVGDADWPAILDHETWERVRLVLLAPDRGRAHATGRSYLLTGFIYCGKCGKRLVAMPYPNGTRAYGCHVGTTYQGCGGVRRKAESVDRLIREAVFSHFDDHPWLLRTLEATEHTLPEHKSGRRPTPMPTAAASGQNVRQAWESASLTGRRELIDALIERIVVLPQPTSTFKPDSIQITWRVAVRGPANSIGLVDYHDAKSGNKEEIR